MEFREATSLSSMWFKKKPENKTDSRLPMETPSTCLYSLPFAEKNLFYGGFQQMFNEYLPVAKRGEFT